MDILVYGYGKMASAMVEGWLRAGMDPARIIAFNPREKEVAEGVTLTTEVPERHFDAVLLGFKPHMLGDIAPEMQPCIGPETVVLSILAGLELDTIASAFPEAGGWVRFMPNLAVALGKSPNLLAARGLSDGQREDVTRLADMLGSAEWLGGEEHFDLATALSGSGPAFVYRFIDALSAAGQQLGLEQGLSDRLALGMVEGAVSLAAEAPYSPGELADRVASPGGMTREGMNVLDDDKALEKLLVSMLKATADKGSELAAKARGEG
ncbi:pyrroline-5-carboxylate reductase [Altererythrobacter xiamenensis]|uniref:Pyrroline-5-carboxylate reductase n=1 Tax=Altererythrobacter xiamenensis TaxID=1316679 RepID=A0A1Y6EK86_9SPHN|nr:pyrroline-5-carboxylate reductase dimerization domain-containing protein [Altererythrobacter xiamenensis]SMQ61611.1 pyrroline-5-carboxylate reductase [Altererythrobacter xiamenensis]